MTKDVFDLPDMDDLSRQMEEAMTEAKKAMDDLPTQMDEMENVMGSLSALLEGMPTQMEELSTVMGGARSNIKRTSNHWPGSQIGQWKRAFGWERNCT